MAPKLSVVHSNGHSFPVGRPGSVANWHPLPHRIHQVGFRQPPHLHSHSHLRDHQRPGAGSDGRDWTLQGAETQRPLKAWSLLPMQVTWPSPASAGGKHPFPVGRPWRGGRMKGRESWGLNYPIDDISDLTGAFPVAWGWGWGRRITVKVHTRTQHSRGGNSSLYKDSPGLSPDH